MMITVNDDNILQMIIINNNKCDPVDKKETERKKNRGKRKEIILANGLMAS